MIQSTSWLRIVLLLLVVSFVSGCSSGKIVKSYAGEDRAVEQIAVLTAPENIRVVAIDGVKMPTYMLSGITTNYGLLPGEHLIEFEYEQVWAIGKPDADGRKAKEVVSGAREAKISVAAGQAFTFRFDRPESLSGAEASVTTFKAEIVDAAGSVVAISAVKPQEKVAVEKYAVAVPQPLGQGDSGVANVSKLDALKTLWSSMNADEKKAFLTWAFQ